MPITGTEGVSFGQVSRSRLRGKERNLSQPPNPPTEDTEPEAAVIEATVEPGGARAASPESLGPLTVAPTTSTPDVDFVAVVTLIKK